MRTLPVTIILWLVCFCDTLAQKPVRYGYDAAGNRTSRMIVVQQQATVRKALTANDSVRHDNVAGHKVSISASPSESRLGISVDGLDTGQCADVAVYTMDGALVARSEVGSTGGMVDLSASPRGVYAMRINVGGKTETWKIVKR